MELISLPDASRIAEVSVTTLRNYIRDKRLAAYEKGSRLMVERGEHRPTGGNAGTAR